MNLKLPKINKAAKKAPKKAPKKIHKKQTRAKHTALRLTHVVRGAAPAGGHKIDEWYNPDENSEHEDHFPSPPRGVRAYSFADKKYHVTFRFEDQGDKAYTVDIYEGETFHDCISRHQIAPPTMCNVPSELLQEDQFHSGPNGCGDCIGFFPPKYVKDLPPSWPGEVRRLRTFINQRLDHNATQESRGNPERIRFLCVTNFVPELANVEVFLPHNYYKNAVYSTSPDTKDI